MQETSLVSVNYVQKWLHVDNGRLTVTPHCRLPISFCTEEHVVYLNTPTASPAVLNSFKLTVFFACAVIVCSRNTADVDQVNRDISSRTSDALSFTIILTLFWAFWRTVLPTCSVGRDHISKVYPDCSFASEHLASQNRASYCLHLSLLSPCETGQPFMYHQLRSILFMYLADISNPSQSQYYPYTLCHLS